MAKKLGINHVVLEGIIFNRYPPRTYKDNVCITYDLALEGQFELGSQIKGIVRVEYWNPLEIPVNQRVIVTGELRVDEYKEKRYIKIRANRIEQIKPYEINFSSKTKDDLVPPIVKPNGTKVQGTIEDLVEEAATKPITKIEDDDELEDFEW